MLIVPYRLARPEGHIVPVNGGVSVDFSRMNRVLVVTKPAGHG